MEIALQIFQLHRMCAVVGLIGYYIPCIELHVQICVGFILVIRTLPTEDILIIFQIFHLQSAHINAVWDLYASAVLTTMRMY